MKLLKRTLSLLLVFCLIVSMASICAFADELTEEPAVEEPVVEEPVVEEPAQEEPVVDEPAAEEPVVDEPAAEEPAAEEPVAEEPAAEEPAEEELAEEAAVMPAVEATRSARDASGDSFYKIVHVDCGRKYFSPENIKKIIDNAAAAGFNQVELYLSDNQGFRFALDDMNVTTSTGNTYDLTLALGDGYSDGSKYPDGSGKYLTQSEMTDIISYAKGKGIDIVPCINVPGHMGAILEAFTGFRYSSSKSSIDLENAEAVAFALAITEKYATYFASQGVKFYNLGADEYANDMSTMGFQGLYTSGKYQKFVDFLNNAAQIVINHGMTPRAFNDGICYNNNTSYDINKAIQVCYWSNGWNGYNVASAATLDNAGYDLINAHGGYYWVLGNTGWQCSAEKASGFDYTAFQGDTVDNPAGAMFCIWCDVGSANGTDGGTAVVNATADVIAAFGATLPQPEANTVTCPNFNITVAAPGLTGVECSKVESPVYVAAEGEAVVGYNITPNVNGAAYTGSAKVTIAVPDDLAGFNTIKVYDAANKTFLTGVTVADSVVTFTAPHFSEYDLVGLDEDVVDADPINITVGGNHTVTISGANYADDYTIEDPSIVTVEVTGKDAVEATTTYTQATNVSCNTLLSSDSSSWRAATDYYFKADDGNYYPVYVQRSYTRNWSWSEFNYVYTYTYTWGYSTTGSSSNVTEIGTQETTSTSTTANITVYTKSETAATPASTTVTFTGVAAGTTYVTIGNTRYTINVLAEDLSKVTPLTVEYWITNRQVTAGGATSKTIAATETGVYSEKGTLFSDLVPATGTRDSNTMVFWKGTRLASNNKQTTGAGVDKTTSGTDFTYIRYWNDSWAYSADGETWTNVASGDQIVAYYYQKTVVTDEVTTYVVDWGPDYDKYTDRGNYVLLDFAVKYESGERVPNSFPNTTAGKKTIGFHCDTSSNNLNKTVFRDGDTYYRLLGMIKADETANYEVYMITLTPTNDTKTVQLSGTSASANNSYTYDNKDNSTEKVVWVDDEANLGAFADASLHAEDYYVGGDPVVPKLKIYNKQGMLVTYYVRAKVTEDSLQVHYIDQTANQEFYNYNIAVASGTLFKENIGLANPWMGALANGSVINIQGRTQTVSADLSTMPAIGAQYRYSEYTCVNVVRSEDGKDVYLYYTFNNAHSFVVDFGLPVEISISNDLKLSSDGLKISVAGAKYGTATVTDNTITYKPSETLKGIETLQLTLIGATEGDSATHQIYIYPATTVYYEEGFATLTGFSEGSKGTETQATQVAGQSKDEYGYDAKYFNEANGASNGTEATSSTKGDKATFSFTGTGVEIYANCTTDTGTMMIQIKNAAGNTVKLAMVDTAMKDGNTGATTGQSVNAYNVPVASYTKLDHGAYTVTVTNASRGDNTEVNLDGFRVYGTLENQENDVYTADLEDDPTFIELRDKVLAGLDVKVEGQYASQIAKNSLAQVYATGSSTEGAVVLSANETFGSSTDVQDLLDNGPKNEIYLRQNQSLVFKIDTPREVQIGLKALNAGTTCSINNTSVNLNSSTDMFYTVQNKGTSGEQTITITNNGSGILAITKLKICDDPNATLGALTEKDLIPALLSLGFENEPDVEYAEASLTVKVGRSKTTLTKTGVKGEKVTFTAEEIEEAALSLAGNGYRVTGRIRDISVKCGQSRSTTVYVVSTRRPDGHGIIGNIFDRLFDFFH